MTRTARILCLVAVPSIIAAAASTAHGHARLKSPIPRDTHSDYKSPPVGNVGIGEPCGVARTASQPSNTLTPGAQMTVTFEETVTHNGCFVVDFSSGNDANFQVIGVTESLQQGNQQQEQVHDRLPRHFFVYFFVTGFFGASLAFNLAGLARVALIALSGTLETAHVGAEYFAILPLMSLGEAVANGMLLGMAVVHRSGWVMSFDDRLYLSRR